MLLQRAAERDYPAIVELANLAFRGSGGWNSEAELIEGTRLTESLLTEELAASLEAHLLTYREGDQPDGPLLGTVWLEPKADGIWYLGLLTVRPEMQDRQLGRALLAAAEEFARQRNARRIRMTVIHQRGALIAWYRRRGYLLTGETKPFSYGDERFGRPLRDDLYFEVLEKEL